MYEKYLGLLKKMLAEKEYVDYKEFASAIGKSPTYASLILQIICSEAGGVYKRGRCMRSQ